jgi:hypothetical protein
VLSKFRRLASLDPPKLVDFVLTVLRLASLDPRAPWGSDCPHPLGVSLRGLDPRFFLVLTVLRLASLDPRAPWGSSSGFVSRFARPSPLGRLASLDPRFVGPFLASLVW